MLFYRCKCGKLASYGSMPPDRCASCPDCGSDLAPAPDAHTGPKPHEFSLTSTVDTDEGPKPLTRCRWCYRTRAEVEARTRR